MILRGAANPPFFHTQKRRNMITKDMFIADIIQKYPETLPVFKKFKLDCYECQIAEIETLEHGAKIHHLISVDSLLESLNNSISK